MLRCYQSLKEHKLFFHSDSKEKAFICEICKKTFARKNSLQRHHKYVHEERKKLSCGICGREFICPFELAKHTKRIHNETVFECDICNVKVKNIKAHK